MVVEYQELPAIVTMEEAIQAQSFHPWPNNVTHHPHLPTSSLPQPSPAPLQKIECGDVDGVFASAQHVVEGSIRTGDLSSTSHRTPSTTRGPGALLPGDSGQPGGARGGRGGRRLRLHPEPHPHPGNEWQGWLVARSKTSGSPVGIFLVLEFLPRKCLP